MTIERSPLPGDDLPDGTRAAQAGGTNGSLTVAASATFGPTSYGPAPDLDVSGPVTAGRDDIERGFAAVEVARTPMFDDGSGEAPTGDPFTYGGFLGRPRGTSR